MPISSIVKPDSGKIDINCLVYISRASRECAIIGIIS
jgi:hypothetical protein